MTFGELLSDQLDALLPRYKAKITGSQFKAGELKTGVRQRLAYLQAPKTGVTDRRLVQLLGIKSETLRAWKAGTVPSSASRAKIENVYLQFSRINNRARILRLVRNDKVKITGEGETRFMNIRPREWEQFVTRWSHGDTSGMDDIWSAKLAEITSDEEWWLTPDDVELV